VFLLQFAAAENFRRTSRGFGYGHDCFASKPRPPKCGGRLQVADRGSGAWEIVLERAWRLLVKYFDRLRSLSLLALRVVLGIVLEQNPTNFVASSARFILVHRHASVLEPTERDSIPRVEVLALGNHARRR